MNSTPQEGRIPPRRLQSSPVGSNSFDRGLPVTGLPVIQPAEVE